MPRLPLSRRVVCPSCGAVVGAFCVNADGEPFEKSGSHGARTALARSQPIPEMAWLLRACEQAAPGFVWRREGASVIAQVDGCVVAVSLSRIVATGATTLTRLTRRASLKSTLVGVLTALGCGEEVAADHAPRPRIPRPSLATVQAAAPRLTWRLSLMDVPTAMIGRYQIVVNDALVCVFYKPPRGRRQKKLQIALRKKGLSSALEKARVFVATT